MQHQRQNPTNDRVATAIVIFDGMCSLCDAAVQFVIANDPPARFHFAALQSPAAAAALAPFAGDPADLQSIVLVDSDGVHSGSTAALRIARGLRRPWCWLAQLEAVPNRIRDPLYEWIASNRYHWFGRRTTCARPTPAQAARFLAGG